ncbi:Histone acetyltransferase of the MYST family 1, partial [Linum perenne]
MPSLPENAAPTEADASRKRRSSFLPLEVGTRVMCRWRDGKYHPVKVIERRKVSFSDPNDYEYYVHYTEFNRRLDEWVKLEQLDLDSVEAVVDEKVEEQGRMREWKQGRKWRLVVVRLRPSKERENG